MGAYIAIAGLSAVVFIFICLLIAMGPTSPLWLSEGHEPDPECDDCKGTGVLNAGHEHLEMACPCTDRFY